MEPRTNVTADPRRAVDSAGTTAGGALTSPLPPVSRRGAKVANGPWLRLYAEILDNPKIQLLPDKYFRWWVNLICLAKLGDGKLPQVKALAWRLRRPEKETSDAIAALIDAGLLDNTNGCVTPHDWSEHQYASDSSAERVKRYREKQRNATCNVTPGVTVTVQNRAEQNRTEQSRTEQSKLERSFDAIYDRHPKKIKRTLAEQQYVALLAHLPDEDQAALTQVIDAGHRTQYEGFNGETKFVPSLDAWLRDRRWTDTVEARAPEPVERKWTPEEIAAHEQREFEEVIRLKAEQKARVEEQRARLEK